MSQGDWSEKIIMKTAKFPKTYNIIGVFSILCIWGVIIALHTGIVFNPWIYGEMLELQKEEGEMWNKYNMKLPTDFDNPLHIQKTEHNLIESLKSEEIPRNCDACEYILQDWISVSEESIPTIKPFLISFLEKDSDSLKMYTINILTKYRIKAKGPVRPFLGNSNPFLRIAAKEYFRVLGEDIDPKDDKDFFDWDAKYDAIVYKSIKKSILVGIVLTVIVLGARILFCNKIRKTPE